MARIIFSLMAIIMSIVIIMLILRLVIFEDKMRIYDILYLIFVFLLFLTGCFLSWHVRIIVDLNKKTMVLYNLRKVTINLQNLKTIEVHTLEVFDVKKHCIVKFQLKNGDVYEYVNYCTLSKNKTTEITRKKVELINQYLITNGLMSSF